MPLMPASDTHHSHTECRLARQLMGRRVGVNAGAITVGGYDGGMVYQDGRRLDSLRRRL